MWSEQRHSRALRPCVLDDHRQEAGKEQADTEDHHPDQRFTPDLSSENGTTAPLGDMVEYEKLAELSFPVYKGCMPKSFTPSKFSRAPKETSNGQPGASSEVRDGEKMQKACVADSKAYEEAGPKDKKSEEWLVAGTKLSSLFEAGRAIGMDADKLQANNYVECFRHEGVYVEDKEGPAPACTDRHLTLLTGLLACALKNIFKKNNLLRRLCGEIPADACLTCTVDLEKGFEQKTQARWTDGRTTNSVEAGSNGGENDSDSSGSLFSKTAKRVDRQVLRYRGTATRSADF